MTDGLLTANAALERALDRLQAENDIIRAENETLQREILRLREEHVSEYRTLGRIYKFAEMMQNSKSRPRFILGDLLLDWDIYPLMGEGFKLVLRFPMTDPHASALHYFSRHHATLREIQEGTK